MNKKILRQQILAQQGAYQNNAADRRIIEHFIFSDFFKHNENMMLYASYDNEIPTQVILNRALESGKTVALPACIPENHQIAVTHLQRMDDLVPGHYNIPEIPAENRSLIDTSALDLVLVPGIAFTKDGARLGYGGGYYDRFLPTLSESCITVSIIRKDFIYDRLPTDAHDQAVDYLISEEGIIACNTNRKPKELDT